jgi:GNAT superfamily N-acetyltransferase
MSTRTLIRRVSHSEILCAANAQELIDEYAAECSIPQIGKIDQQGETYAQLEAAGLMSCFGVFDGERLVGFASVLMSVLPHYGRKVATVESVFLAASHRAGGTGRALMDAIEEEAKQAECVAILYSAPAYSRFNYVLAALRAYSCTGLVYCRSFA